MGRRWSRPTGGASLVGAVLAVVVSVPPAWYGIEPTDSYVFDPPVPSPLWFAREVEPALSVVAAVGLLLGVVGLVRRDWPVVGWARRWGGAGGVLAFAGLAVAVVAGASATRGDLLLPLVSLVFGGMGVLLLVPATVLLAYGYARTARPHVGYAFAGLLVGVPVLGYLAPAPVQTLVASLPVGVAWWVVGIELLRHPDPLPGRDGDADE